MTGGLVSHWVLALAAGAAILALALAALAYLRLSRHLAALARAAEELATGDPAAQVPAPRPGDAGRLATALEDLRLRLTSLRSDLTSRQAEAEAIVTGVVEGVFTVDRQRRIRYLNPQMSRELGIGPEEALGQFCGDVLRPESQGGGRPCDENCPIVHARFRGGARATEHLTLRSGERRSVVITSAPMTADLQVQVLRDETEVEAAGRLRDAILANISHEFRTPLSAQLASLELLRDRRPELSGEQADELLASLQRGALRLTQLIDNLLESVRIESNGAGIRRGPVNLDDVVEQAVEWTRPLLDQKRQPITVELPYPLPAVQGDAPRLVQVFVNLLANANKFAPEGAPVAVGGAVAEAEVALWVEDEGPGLPEGVQDELFARFWRSAGDEPAPGGVGLGLYIVKSIVERHGGRIAASRIGGRTRMAVVLPVSGG